MNITRIAQLIIWSLFLTESYGQTIISGGPISGVWGISGSPYIIEQDVNIPLDSVLIIEPGVVVEIGFYHDIDVYGQLLAVGTITDSIVFKRSDVGLKWGRITLSNITPSQDSTVFTYCKMIGGIDGVFVNNSTKARITHCFLTGMDGDGISVYNSSPIIANNLITENQGAGIVMNLSNSDLIGNTIMECEQSGMVVTNSNSTIRNNLITRCTSNGFIYSSTAGGIYVRSGSNVVIEENEIVENTRGGIFIKESVATIQNNQINSNVRSEILIGDPFGGGIRCEDSEVVVLNNTIDGNSAIGEDDQLSDYDRGRGGGIYARHCHMNIEGNLISGNTSSSYGGGIYIDSAFTITGNIISQNVANPDNYPNFNDGGGIFVDTSSYPSIISYNTISECGAQHGGGIMCRRSSPLIIGDSILNTTSGAGIFLTYSNSNVDSCYLSGSAIRCYRSNDTISNSTIKDNVAYGIYSTEASAYILNNQILDNGTNGIVSFESNLRVVSNTISGNGNGLSGNGSGLIEYGGGIYTDSLYQIIGNTITGNHAQHGGGICVRFAATLGKPLIEGNTIAYNQASVAGGGIYYEYGNPPLIQNNRILNNYAPIGGGVKCNGDGGILINNLVCNNEAYTGAGISTGAQFTKIINSTICNNKTVFDQSGDYGRGAAIHGGEADVHNNIIWGNESASFGSIIAVGSEVFYSMYHSVLQNDTNSIQVLPSGAVPISLINTLSDDPQFVAPSAGAGIAFDGVNADWSLQNTSPCINSGTPDTSGLYLPSADLVGNDRIAGNLVDIGAYENVSAIYSEYLNVVACDSMVSPSGSYVWTQNGYYRDTIFCQPGCDTVYFVDLAIGYPQMVSLTITACDSILSTSGQEYWTASGTYIDTISNIFGCDSIIATVLTVVNSSTSTSTIQACDEILSPSGNYTWTQTGIYSDTIPNSVGCDSICVVNLTINYSSSDNLVLSVCDTFHSPSGNYFWSTSGIYVDTVPNSVGCDSIITFDLTIELIDATVTHQSALLTSNEFGGNWQWIDCDNNYLPLPNETSQDFWASQNGNYAVVVEHNGCIDTSSCYLVNAYVCSANFILIQDPQTQHNWFAISGSSGSDPLTYEWSWGDGNISTGPYPSHTYDTAGYYNICLTISDAAGCTDTYCDNSTYIYKTMDMVTINVVDEIPSGINENGTSLEATFYPNPTSSNIQIELGTTNQTVSINAYNIFGELVQTESRNAAGLFTYIMPKPKGVYLIQLVYADGNTTNLKVVKE